MDSRQHHFHASPKSLAHAFILKPTFPNPSRNSTVIDPNTSQPPTFCLAPQNSHNMDKAAKKLVETTSAALQASEPAPAALVASAVLEKASDLTREAAEASMKAAKEAGKSVRFYHPFLSRDFLLKPT
jgi:hypothetical protein